MAEHPKAFISYSHDSPEHKQWVLELGTKLRRNGVDVMLDQWALRPGADFTRFMEHGIRDFDRVLVICTDNYVRKANDREGGVGYEVQIVTTELVTDLGIDKFIPIIRQASGKKKAPTCLGARVYIDFTDESQFDEKFGELLRELYDVPIVEKPPLGEKPSFIKQEVSPVEGLDTQLPEIPEQVVSASEAYSAAVEITRAEDEIGWRQLVKQIKSSAFNSLAQRRQEGLVGETPTGKEKLETVDEGVGIISPVISVALAGVESKKEQFRDQKSTLEDLLNIARSNLTSGWVNIPRALGYVYHSLHGSLSLSTNQLDLALSLARVKIPDLYTTVHRYVWEERALMGWSELFGPSCTEAWQYLAKAGDRWEWLAPIFGDELEYRTSLVAYYMALHIHELASIIASGQEDKLNASFNSTSPFNFMVPLDFISEGWDINQRAMSLLLRNPEALMELWTSLNVTREQMEYSWENWISLYKDWLFNVYGFSFDTRVSHQHLFEVL